MNLSTLLPALSVGMLLGGVLIAAVFLGRRRGALQLARPEQWSIGIYTGSSPFRLASADQVTNPVLTAADVSDFEASFVADPFMMRVAATWYMFFEAVSARSKKGMIAMATSSDGMHWTYDRVVLQEPFHMSYPYVFKWEGRYFMVPESRATYSVRLYEAQAFPYGWTPVGTLLYGDYSDPSLFRHDGQWWMFASNWHSVLHLFRAEQLEGPWVEHPSSPVIANNPHIARPAGRVLCHDGRLIRFTQDTYPEYGNQTRAFEITKLTATAYEERPLPSNPVLQASGQGWNGRGMHHVDAHRLPSGHWLACVDGYAGRRLRVGFRVGAWRRSFMVGSVF